MSISVGGMDLIGIVAGLEETHNRQAAIRYNNFMARCILHVDMDAFFAAVEQRDHPELRGRPVLVGSDRPRGVVAAASYEARKFGCHSAQPMVIARRLCPQAVIVSAGFARYRAVSNEIFEILHGFTPVVEPLSIDEAFLDVTDSRRLLGSGEQIAIAIRQRIFNQTKLTASVGVAENKFLAKLASDLNKPDGLTVITPENLEEVLSPLPVGRIWGIGPKAAKKLEGMNLKTIGDLRRMTAGWFTDHFGSDGEHYRRLVFGLDDRPVQGDAQAKQISQEVTFEVDLADAEEVRGVLLEQVEQVARRLRRHGLLAGGVTLKIRYGDFQTITRSMTAVEPTDVTAELWRMGLDVFNRWADRGFQPVRLIGFAARSLTSERPQAMLFEDPAGMRQKRVDQVVDAITHRLGPGAIRRGR